jgi:hypothetical protein
MFRIAGQAGYAKATGITRKRIDAMLISYLRMPQPA